VVTHQLQVKRRTGKVRRPETDDLPLSHATNPKCRCNKDIRKYFFSDRVVSKWNMLDNDSVMAKTVNGFKTKLEWERAKKMGLFLD